MKPVAAVVVTWNGSATVRDCLRSLESSTANPRTYVVDNASSDGTPSVVAGAHSSATLVRLRRNLGFARGCNVGIRRAFEDGAGHVFLLNQDATVEPDTIEGLAALQENRPEFGLLSPLHLDGTGEHLDRRFARYLAAAPELRRMLGDALLGRPGEVYGVAFVNAAAWMLSRECIHRAGLFNPVFPHFWEDRDLAERILRRGFQVGIAPAFRAWHYRRQDDGPEPSERERLLRRGRLLYTLSRARPGVLLDVLRVLARLARPGRGWAGAIAFVLPRASAAIRNRSEAIDAERPFFRAAEDDERTHAL